MTLTATLVGLIGADIQGSAGPELHMTEGLAQGLPYVYRLIDLTRLGLTPEALPELLISAERCGFTALAITHPCKQAVIPHLTELSPDAEALGARVDNGGGMNIHQAVAQFRLFTGREPNVERMAASFARIVGV